MAKPPAKDPKAKAEKKPKLTDAERHRRFVEVARKVEANESPEAFDQAFDKVVTHRSVTDPAAGLEKPGK